MLARQILAPHWRIALGLLLVGGLLAGGWPVGAGDTGGPDEQNERPLDPQEGVWIDEVVTHPLSDWVGNERVSTLDEYVVLRNHGSQAVDVTGWVLHMMDGTDEQVVLEGTLGSGEALFLLNPPGQLNNDVRLRLFDGDGMDGDDVTLGENGVPEGRGDSVLDEAVHLAGPWAGLRAPGTGGRGLGPFWVSHFAAASVLEHVEPLHDAWVAPEQTALALKIQQAPGFSVEDWDLRVDGGLEPLRLVDGKADVWRSDPLVFVDGQQVKLESATHEVDGFPAGSKLSVRVDPEPPYFEDGENATQPPVGKIAIADGQRRIHWFPEIIEGPSGIVSVEVENVTGASLPDCLPLDSPGPDCVVGPDENEVVVVVRDGAGRLVNETLPMEVWDKSPEVPEIRFLEGPPPWIVWDHGPRAFERIVVESAQDVTGAWPVREVTLAGNATQHQDVQWEPGEPRAYRLKVSDLAGNNATGPWVALDPEDVPVQAQLQLPEDLDSLASQGKTEVTVAFDRGLDQAPKLILEVFSPQPLFQQITGEPMAGEDTFSYLVDLPGPLQEAESGWSLVGGRGLDQAPIAPLQENVTWDLKPPRLEFTGMGTTWVQGTRHVVTVSVMDGLDDAPRVSISHLPENGSVEERGATTRVTLQGEGWMQVAGHAEDAAGNRASFELEVGLDGSPPGVSGLQKPQLWSSDEPFGFEVEDEASGVNASSVQAWVRNESAVFEPRVQVDEAGQAQVFPPNGTQARGPFEVYVAVADRAGNGVEGFLSHRLVPVASTQADNESVTVIALDDSGPGSGAPAFFGPPWLEGGGEQESTITATGGEESNEGISGSQWDDFSWDDVEEEDEERSFGWYLLGVMGLMGLGTAVHQVGRHRKKVHKRSAEKGENAGPGAAGASVDKEDEPREERPEPAEPGSDVMIASSRTPTETSGPVVWIAPAEDSKEVETDARASGTASALTACPDETSHVAHEVLGLAWFPVMNPHPVWDVDCDRDPDDEHGSAGWAHVVVESPPAVGVA